MARSHHEDRKYRRGQRAKMAAQVHRAATAALRDLGSQGIVCGGAGVLVAGVD